MKKCLMENSIKHDSQAIQEAQLFKLLCIDTHRHTGNPPKSHITRDINVSVMSVFNVVSIKWRGEKETGDLVEKDTNE